MNSEHRGEWLKQKNLTTTDFSKSTSDVIDLKGGWNMKTKCSWRGVRRLINSVLLIIVLLAVSVSASAYFNITVQQPAPNFTVVNPVDIVGTWRVTNNPPGNINQYNVQIDWGDGNLTNAVNINRTETGSGSAQQFSGNFSTFTIPGCNASDGKDNCSNGIFSHYYETSQICKQIQITVKLYHSNPPGAESGDAVLNFTTTLYPGYYTCDGNTIISHSFSCDQNQSIETNKTIKDCNEYTHNLCSDTYNWVHQTGMCVNNQSWCTVTNSTGDCRDNLACNGVETCSEGTCLAGTPRDCSANNASEIATCDNTPDNYHPTWDYRPTFTSTCDKTSDMCTTVNDENITHTCNVESCGAECDATHGCPAGQTCNQSCACEGTPWSCVTDSDCTADSYTCEGNSVMLNNNYCDQVDHTCKNNTSLVDNCSLESGWYNTTNTQWVNDTQCSEKEQLQQEYRVYECTPGACVYNLTDIQWIDTGNARNKPDGTSCDDGLFCTVNDQCTQGVCGGASRDCSANDASGIATCENIPDNYTPTWDYRAAFTSQCIEDGNNTGYCTTVDSTITHTCNVESCSAECDATYECQNKCVDNVRYSSGSCDLASACTCSYSTEDCSSQNGCYAYETGCEDRTYYCAPGSCEYNYSNRNTDYNESSLLYCSFDTVKGHVQSHDFYCEGTCQDHSTWVDDQLVENCSLNDGWYNTTNTQWVNDTQCTEKEQVQQEYKDYTCNESPSVGCTYGVTDSQWIDTGSTRNKQDGTACDDGFFCTVDDSCNSGACGGTARDCSANNIGGTATCNNDPDNISVTWDYKQAFTSTCDETSGTCTTSDQAITHTCNVESCGAECDAAHECAPNLNGDSCYYGGTCNTDPTSCACSYNNEEYCPTPGTISNGTCYYGTRDCTVEGCTLSAEDMDGYEICNPNYGPQMLMITCEPATISTGEISKCNAGFNSSGVITDVTNSTNFTSSGGTILGNSFSSTIPGTYTVTGIYDSLNSSSDVTVTYGTAASLTVTCSPQTITAGGTTTCTATVSDSYNNSWDVTTETNFSAQDGAGGSWSGNVYTSQNSGTWTVTGIYEVLNGTTTIKINTPPSPPPQQYQSPTYSSYSSASLGCAYNDPTCREGYECVNNTCVPVQQPTQPFCGDGVCNADENCSTCSQDCGTCPIQPPVEQVYNATLTIYKNVLNSSGGDISDNHVFVITLSDGQNATVSENSPAILLVNPGVITVTEMPDPDYVLLNYTPALITLESNGTGSITIFNKQKTIAKPPQNVTTQTTPPTIAQALSAYAPLCLSLFVLLALLIFALSRRRKSSMGKK